jgi:hypothetical protein
MTECIHLIEASSCGDCRPRPPAGVPAAAPPRLGRLRRAVADGPGPWFEAAYPGVCSRDGDEIEPGEDVRADGSGGWEHRYCVPGEEPPGWLPDHLRSD